MTIIKKRFRLACSIALLSATSAVKADEPTHLYWGETHLHTRYSSDAFLNGNYSVGPDEAYRFAKGERIPHPYHGELVGLARPLDFLVVSDHAEALGVVNSVYFQSDYGDIGWLDKIRRTLVHWLLKAILGSGNGAQTFREIQAPIEDVVEGDPVAHPQNKLPGGVGLFGDVSDIQENIWANIIAAAERHYQPGVFTSFIGWEWSSTPMGANLHRVVFTPNGAEAASQYFPFSSFDSQYPEDLWQWLEKTEAASQSDFVAIPHNANVSKGNMFAETNLKGEKITPDYARLRARFETVVEATQTKGDSETWPSLSPNDPFADFAVRKSVVGGTSVVVRVGPAGSRLQSRRTEK